MKRLISGFFVLCVCLAVFPSITVNADYRYDEYSQTVPAQSAYVADKNYNGKQLDIGDFKSPADIYVYDDSLIFVLDSGNNRIVVLDDSFVVSRVIDAVVWESEALDISGAKGIYVSGEGDVYVADTQNGRIIVMDQEGKVSRVITRPDSVLFTENITFIPRNVVTDAIGTIYTISENSTQGAYMINQEGEFLGFYGRNKMTVTADVLFEATLRKFATEEQRAKMSNFIPVEFSNFDVDAEGFVYTVTSYSESPRTSSMIRKLNPLGENILSNEYRTWGDEPDGANYRTNYADVAVDSNGFIYALDSYNGRIFMYDNTGFQVAIFGGSGTQLGNFTSATAIDTLGDKILVLDSTKNNITVFNRTYFGELLVKGLILYNQGRLDESLSYFEKLVDMDSNFFYAYYAMAEAYYDKGEYKTAEAYAEKTSISQDVYSKAKKMVRNDWLREHFAIVFFLVICAALAIMAASKVMAAKRKNVLR
ncbi:MAG: NHL repeat-containing protein [Lachnospiraceae bacterium]|nr:NHL repeat-containing protein [Lachnospiraceae bacterium]MCM1231975.1 NHL repeat-containing protein [Ruminococcus flavefaciens]